LPPGIGGRARYQRLDADIRMVERVDEMAQRLIIKLVRLLGNR
jgi:hypothetical protein